MERKNNIIAYLAVSMDMKIADPNGNTDWLPSTSTWPEEVTKSHEKFIEKVHTVICGRKTFEKEAELNAGKCWPDKRVFVFSRFPQNVAQYKNMKNVSFFSGALKPFIEQIQKDVPKDRYIWVAGGGEFVSSLVNENLIDIFELYMVPIVVGSGISLFQTKKRLDFISEPPVRTSDGMIRLRFLKK